MNLTLDGNIATIQCNGLHGAMRHVQELGLENQFSVRSDEQGTYLSFPMTKAHHTTFAGQIHRLKNEKTKPKGPTKPTDPTPPSGGTPTAGRVVELHNTFAIAA